MFKPVQSAIFASLCVILMLLLSENASGKIIDEPWKTASGEFFEFDLTEYREETPDSLKQHQEIRWVEVRIVSGVAYYAYCHNDPINKVDILGLAESYIFKSGSAWWYDNGGKRTFIGWATSTDNYDNRMIYLTASSKKDLMLPEATDAVSAYVIHQAFKASRGADGNFDGFQRHVGAIYHGIAAKFGGAVAYEKYRKANWKKYVGKMAPSIDTSKAPEYNMKDFLASMVTGAEKAMVETAQVGMMMNQPQAFLNGDLDSSFTLMNQQSVARADLFYKYTGTTQNHLVYDYSPYFTGFAFGGVQSIPKVGKRFSGKGPLIYVERRVFTSADKHVGEAATKLDEVFPGRIVSVNAEIPMLNGLTREVDIIMDQFIIQVKQGKANGLVKQIKATQRDANGKIVIGFAPDNYSNMAWEGAAKNGIPIARNMDELLLIIRELSK